jgi:excisionase family DNA binding protein
MRNRRERRTLDWLKHQAPATINANEAAEIIGKHRTTIIRMVERGQLSGTRSVQQVLIPRSEVLALCGVKD